MVKGLKVATWNVEGIAPNVEELNRKLRNRKTEN
jgi:hypothetical protein